MAFCGLERVSMSCGRRQSARAVRASRVCHRGAGQGAREPQPSPVVSAVFSPAAAAAAAASPFGEFDLPAASSNPVLLRAIYGQRAFVSCHRCPQMAKLDMPPKEQ